MKIAKPALVLGCLFAARAVSAQPSEAQPAPPPAPGPAQPGGVCVTIDPSRDTLAEGERNAARALLMQAFESEHIATDSSGTACGETYAVSNVKLGNTINVM